VLKYILYDVESLDHRFYLAYEISLASNISPFLKESIEDIGIIFLVLLC